MSSMFLEMIQCPALSFTFNRIFSFIYKNKQLYLLTHPLKNGLMMSRILLILLLLVVGITAWGQGGQCSPKKKQASETIKRDSVPPTAQSPQKTVKKNDDTTRYVYICNGPASKKYHKTKNCRGLTRCSTTTEKISQKEAIQKRRTACKICYQ